LVGERIRFYEEFGGDFGGGVGIGGVELGGEWVRGRVIASNFAIDFVGGNVKEELELSVITGAF
jgi:hypothetical protein